MDSWLWDPPIYEDEDNSSLGGDWQPDFCFWREPDPIANDAANEAACIQVLKILITKADSDITELEEDMILLQSQLAWTDEAWSEMCFIALREKIEFLEMSIKKLKEQNPQDQQNQQEGNVQSQIHIEPAENIHEILKPLLEKYFLHKDEQHTDPNVENQGFRQPMTDTRLINSIAEVCRSKTSGQTTLPLCLEAKEGDDGKNDDQNRDGIMGQHTDAFKESNQRDREKIDAESNRKHGTSDRDLTNKDGKRTYMLENDEQANAVLRNASGIPSSCEAGSNSRKCSGSSDSEGISTEVNMHSFTSENTILNPLPKSKEPTLAELYKLADMLPDSTPDAVEQVTNKSIMKQPMKEEGDADRANKIDPRKQLVMMGRMGRRSPLELKKNDEWLNDRECTIAESLKLLIDNQRKEARKPEIKAMPITQIIEQMQSTKVTGPEESEPNLLHHAQLHPQPAQEPSLAMEMELNPSSMKKLQNWTSMITDRHAGSSSANRSFRRQTLDFRRNRSLSVAPDASMTSDSLSEKKRKHSPISPVIDENKESGNTQTTARRHNDTAHSMIQKDHLTSSCHGTNEAHVDKPLKPLSSSASMEREPDLALEFFPMDTLRKLAKVNNLTGYSKLRKEELLKILKAKSREGDWHEL